MEWEKMIQMTLEASGVPFRGFQRYPGRPELDLVLFNNSEGSTLAIPICEFNLERLKEKLALRNAEGVK